MSAPVLAPVAPVSNSALLTPQSTSAPLTRVSSATTPGAFPAVEVEARLRAALRDLDAARRNAVLWFGEMLARKLYLEFGCSSIHHYARERLGFSRARTAYFLRLCRSFEQLPALRESVASGAVPWTKAREVVKVATPETEGFWVGQAQTTGRRELERRVAATQGAAKARRRSPEQYARYEAMLEKARKSGQRGSREQLFLAAWEMLTRGDISMESDGLGGTAREGFAVRAQRTGASAGPVREHARRRRAASCSTSSPRYQIVIRQCETCGRAEIATGRGTMPIAAKTLETALCDARVHRHGEKNKATIPPSTRREVMARDGHRCRTVGCGSAHFLAVHHNVPRECGGSNEANNLAVLCSRCHGMIHARAGGGAAWPLRHVSEGRDRVVDHPGDQLVVRGGA